MHSHRHPHPHHHGARHWPADGRDLVWLFLRALWLAFIALAAVALLGLAVARLAHHNANTGSSLRGGYTGPPVRVTLTGPRTRAQGGVCLAIVRDGSDSVAREIDPAGQINRELAAVADTLASSGSADLVTAIVFAERAQASDLAPAAGSNAARVLLDGAAGLGGGTNFDAAFTATADQLARCPATAEPHVIIVTDGLPSGDPASIATGLQRLPPHTRVTLLALDLGQWAGVASLWGPPHDLQITLISQLAARVVARAAATAVEDATGQHLTVSFQP